MHPIPIPGDTKDDPGSDDDSSDIGEQAGRGADSESRHGYPATHRQADAGSVGRRCPVRAGDDARKTTGRHWHCHAKSEARYTGRKPIAKDRGTTLRSWPPRASLEKLSHHSSASAGDRLSVSGCPESADRLTCSGFLELSDPRLFGALPKRSSLRFIYRYKTVTAIGPADTVPLTTGAVPVSTLEFATAKFQLPDGSVTDCALVLEL